MGDQRHQRADQQDQHQRAGQLAQQRGADLSRQVRPVRTPDRRLTRGGSVAGEPAWAALQAGVELIQRLAPVVRRDRLVVVCGPGPQGVPGEPEAGQHRQPEAQYAKQQRCRQAGRQRHAGPAEGRHRGGLERTQPTWHDADAAQHAGQHEAGEDAGEGRRVADRVKQRPEGQGVKQDDQQGIAAGPAQQARIAREPGLGREHHRQQALHPAHVLQAPGQGALRQPGDQRCGDRHEAAEQHEGCAGGDHGETAMAAVDRDEQGGAERQQVGHEIGRHADDEAAGNLRRSDAAALQQGDHCHRAAESGGRQGLVDEQLGQAEFGGVPQRQRRARGRQYLAIQLTLDDVSQPLQRDGDQQPGRLGLAENQGEVAGVGQLQDADHQRAEHGRAQQPGHPDQRPGMFGRGGRVERIVHAVHPLLEPTLSIIGPAGEPEIDTDQAPP